MSSTRLFGSTSAEVSPDEGPRILLRSWTSRWKASWGLGLLVDAEAVTGMIARNGRRIIWGAGFIYDESRNFFFSSPVFLMLRIEGSVREGYGFTGP